MEVILLFSPANSLQLSPSNTFVFTKIHLLYAATGQAADDNEAGGRPRRGKKASITVKLLWKAEGTQRRELVKDEKNQKDPIFRFQLPQQAVKDVKDGTQRRGSMTCWVVVKGEKIEPHVWGGIKDTKLRAKYEAWMKSNIELA